MVISRKNKWFCHKISSDREHFLNIYKTCSASVHTSFELNYNEYVAMNSKQKRQYKHAWLDHVDLIASYGILYEKFCPRDYRHKCQVLSLLSIKHKQGKTKSHRKRMIAKDGG